MLPLFLKMNSLIVATIPFVVGAMDQQGGRGAIGLGNGCTHKTQSVKMTQ